MKFGTAITEEQKEIPKFKFAIMGAYDSIAGIMQTFAVNYISNAGTIVLVQQSAIPISMAISVYSLGAKYTPSQYMGAAVVLLGIGVVLIPQLLPAPEVTHMDMMHNTHTHTHTHAYGSSTSSSGVPAAMNTSGTSELMWIFILVLSCIPMVLSSVYKEKALGEMEIDVVFLNGWVAIFQFLMSIPLVWPSSWAINMTNADILPNMIAGFNCWLGYNTITDSSDPTMPADDCTMAPMYVNMYLFFNVVYNILIVVILKHGSSNILWLSSTIIVPLSNIAFSMSFMPGHQDLTNYDIVGLAVIMKGLLVYRFWTPIAKLSRRILTCGGSDADDEDDSNLESKSMTRKIQRKQANFLGLGQMEALSALTNIRIQSERKSTLGRSPQVIRSALLMKLGIPPSPHFNMGKNLSRGNSFIELKTTSRTSSFIEMKERMKEIKPRNFGAPAPMGALEEGTINDDRNRKPL